MAVFTDRFIMYKFDEMTTGQNDSVLPWGMVEL